MLSSSRNGCDKYVDIPSISPKQQFPTDRLTGPNGVSIIPTASRAIQTAPVAAASGSGSDFLVVEISVKRNTKNRTPPGIPLSASR